MQPRRHTILVVDDEPDVVKSVKDLLRFNYNILGATRAADAMKLLEEHEVDIIMTDQRMPEMTGVQLLGKIRGQHPDAVRLLFTGYADIKAVIDAINQGNVYRYITKPWDPDELAGIIREACERHDLIIERKLLMDQLEKTNRDLQHANEELKQTDVLKTAFIRVASHELRTPITILLGLADLAMHAPNAPPMMKDFLARIQHAGRRLMRLVDQVVTMLSAGTFARPMTLETTDLAKLVNDAITDVEPFVTLRRQKLVRDLASGGELGAMSLDAAKIRDSINHVLLNAIKFTPDEGTITVAARRLPDQSAQIRITDTGTGIAPDCLSRVCDPFFTGVDVSRHSSGTFEFGRKGIGLGMSVVKSFVDMHGGNIDIQSEVEKGTSVTITLPSTNPSPPAQAAKSNAIAN